MTRLFVAIDLPGEIKKDLYSICYGVPGAKWVPEEQLHLTLRFIGEVDGGVFTDIKDALEDIRLDAFAMKLKGLGYFPPRKKPRVLWVGVEPKDSVTVLRNRVESRLVKLGLEPEQRKFSPHITIARLKDTPVSKVTRFLEGNGLFATDTFPVSEFHLYSSVLTPKGAIHQLEVSYGLNQPT